MLTSVKLRFWGGKSKIPSTSDRLGWGKHNQNNGAMMDLHQTNRDNGDGLLGTNLIGKEGFIPLEQK